jgi:hypothetical protein
LTGGAAGSGTDQDTGCSGGGAMGGNGGNTGLQSGGAAAAGSTGITLKTVAADPSTVFQP